MRKLSVFNSISLDGYFTDAKGDVRWAHGRDENEDDPEWRSFIQGNARGGGVLLFGRVTYDLMAGYWPTPEAMKTDPVVAEQMNGLPKIVFSRTLQKASWNNTKVIKDDIVGVVRKMKNESGKDMVIFGSGKVITQLANENLIDQYQMVVVPVVLGQGRTMFDGVKGRPIMKLTKTRPFANGNVLLSYVPAK